MATTAKQKAKAYRDANLYNIEIGLDDAYLAGHAAGKEESSVVCIDIRELPNGVTVAETAERLLPHKVIALYRKPITVDEFIFLLNQDEDCLITLTDYNAAMGTQLYHGWKSSLREWEKGLISFRYGDYKGWYVQDFVITQGGMEICITKVLED